MLQCGNVLSDFYQVFTSSFALATSISYNTRITLLSEYICPAIFHFFSAYAEIASILLPV